MKSFLPYTRQTVDDEDIAAVTGVLQSDFLTSGPKVAEFEHALSANVGAQFVVACSSGTAALHLAALALELGPGDRAVVPSITFVATANCVRYTGASVIFADVDPDTGLMEAAHLEEALSMEGPRPKAVFPVHLGGQPCDMSAIREVARANGMMIVEDSCHALGTTADDGSVIGACSHSDMSVFSFHPAKTIAMGEGGAVTTQDPSLAEKMRNFRNHGIVRDTGQLESRTSAAPGYYELQTLGYNYRASDLHCALGASQLSKLDGLVEKRADLVAEYDALLNDLTPLVRPIQRKSTLRTGWHLYQVLIDFGEAGIDREHLMDRLREHGIGTQVHYIPVDSQPYYRKISETPPLPGADSFYGRCLSLPLFAGMNKTDVSRVCTTLKDLLSA